jgi:GT2 family glycosyltransferase
VIVPFAGPPWQLQRLLSELSGLVLGEHDEVIIADNRPVAVRSHRGRIRIEEATGLRTPAFARNRGARAAHGEWLLFIDADTSPAPTLLEDYFSVAPEESTAVLAGGIRDVAGLADGGPAGTVARHSAARSHMSQQATMERARPYAQTANCAVRRGAFEQVGGFEASARAGEDADLCFRLQAAGWGMEGRPAAIVAHHSRPTLSALLGQLVRHGSGAAWVNRRFPGSFPPSPLGQLARRFGRDIEQAVERFAHGDRDGARFALLDFAGGIAFEVGRLAPNRRA